MTFTTQPRFSVSDDIPQQVQVWYNDPSSAPTKDSNDVWQQDGVWVTIPGLRCESLTQTSQPQGGISFAELTYEYGEIDRQDTSRPGFNLYPALGDTNSDLSRLNPYDVDDQGIRKRLMRIMLFDPETGTESYAWAGFVTQTSLNDNRKTGGDGVDYGNQTITLSGLEWLLDRNIRRYSVDTSNHHNMFEQLPFNSPSRTTGGGGTIEGNKAVGDWVFADEVGEAEEWTSWDIIKYLAFHWDSIEEASSKFTIEYEGFTQQQAALASIKPVLETKNQSLFSLLNELLDPRRFLGYDVHYEAGNSATDRGRFLVRFRGANADPVTFLTGVSLTPGDTFDISAADARNVGVRYSLSYDYNGQYDRIVVEGARLGFVTSFQLGAVGTTLASASPGWSGTQENDYKNPVITGSVTEKETKAHEYRSAIPDVFTRFYFPDGEKMEQMLGSVGDPRGYVHGPSTRFSRSLPLRENIDYRTGLLKNVKFATEGEYMSMFATVKLPSSWYPSTGNADRYAYSTDLKDVTSKWDGYAEQVRNFTVRPLDDAPGVKLDVGRGHNHYLASHAGTMDHAPYDERVGALSYQTDIFITAYFQTGKRLNSDGNGPVENYSQNTLTIPLGDSLRKDVIEKGTVLYIDDEGQIVEADTDYTIRDDQFLIDAIASLANEWYGKTRKVAQVRMSGFQAIEPGSILGSLDGTEVNTVVTKVVWDFNDGQTNLATSYAEPDLAALVGF